MRLHTPEQNLRRDLHEVASDLRWSAVELSQIAQRLDLAGNSADAQALARLRQILQQHEAQLTGYAYEVKARVIHRSVEGLEQ